MSFAGESETVAIGRGTSCDPGTLATNVYDFEEARIKLPELLIRIKLFFCRS